MRKLNKTEQLIWEEFKKGNSFECNCEDGSGKTHILIDIAKRLSKDKKEVLLIVHMTPQIKVIESRDKELFNNKNIKILAEHQVIDDNLWNIRFDAVLVDERPNFNWGNVNPYCKSKCQRINLYTRSNFLPFIDLCYKPKHL